MATRTETLTGRLAVDTSAWRGGLAQASTMFRGFASGISRGLSTSFRGALGVVGSSISKLGGMLRSALSIGGLLTGGGILAGLNNMANLGGTLSDLSDRTGMAASSLMLLREQFRQGGIEVDSVTQYIRRMFDALEDPKKANIFKQIGLSQEELSKVSPEEAFNKIIDGVRNLKGKAKQANILSDLFGGRQGINLQTLVSNKDSKKQAEEMVGSMAKEMDKMAPKFDKISDILGPSGLGVKMNQVFFGVLSYYADKLEELADKFAKIDFKAVGTNIAEWLKWGWNQFKALVSNPSSLIASVGQALKGVALLGSAYLLGAITTAVKAGVDFAVSVLPSLASSLWFMMKAAGGALAIGVMEGMETMKDILPPSMQSALDKIMSVGTKFQDATPFGMMMKKLTGTSGNENYEMLKNNPEIVREAFAKGMLEDLNKATDSMDATLTEGSRVFSEAVDGFAPQATLLAMAMESLTTVLNKLDLQAMPSKTPWQAITNYERPGTSTGGFGTPVTAMERLQRARGGTLATGNVANLEQIAREQLEVTKLLLRKQDEQFQ